MDLAALIIAILALVISIMALPTVFQMLWGRPILRIELAKFESNDAAYLRYHVWNDPVKSKLLARLGVHREAAELSGACTVAMEGTNQKIVQLSIFQFRHGEDDAARHFRLPSRIEPAFVNILSHKRSSVPEIYDNDDRHPLAAGTYRIEAKFFLSDGTVYNRTDFLMAGDREERSNWIPIRR